MFFIPGLGCIALSAIAALVPESPRWLEAKGRHAAAEETVRRFERAAPMPLVEISHAPAALDAGLNIGHLLRPPLRSHLWLAVVLAVGGNVAMTAFLTWLPTMLLSNADTG
jgi:MFS transporter, putative metabolite:H+ symporter